MKKGRDFMKRKRLLSAVLAGIFVVSMLGGCASAVPQGATETTQDSAQETDRTSGTVKLRVWAEESTYDALNKMIDSFKEELRFALSILTISLSKYLSAAFVAASPGRRGRINDISCLPDGSWRASARLRDLITQNKKCGGVYAAAPQ